MGIDENFGFAQNILKKYLKKIELLRNVHYSIFETWVYMIKNLIRLYENFEEHFKAR